MFLAYTLNVLIASPSDTREQRDAIRTTILKWNDSNSQFYLVTLLPVMWETHSFPAYGRPQGLVNEQIVAYADILIGTFWTRLGQPTAVAESGTVEEITQFEESGHPILLYFCEANPPMLTLDTKEIDRVKAYRLQMQEKALVGSYVTTAELCEKIREDLTRQIRRMKEAGEIPELPEPVTENVAAESSSQNLNSSTISGAARGSQRNLEDLRPILIGSKARWQAQFTSIDAVDPSIDRRRDLMRDVSRVLWEMVQRVGERCPEASVLTSLASLAAAADELVNLRILADAGRSFNELNDGCRKIIGGVQVIIDEPWQCGST
jgi:hypothetical protein